MSINYGDVPNPDERPKYTRCPNSLSGEHWWVKPIGKNANKPKSCTNCNQLEVDLRKETDNG